MVIYIYTYIYIYIYIYNVRWAKYANESIGMPIDPLVNVFTILPIGTHPMSQAYQSPHWQANGVNYSPMACLG
jgi:hypothetical protein